MRLKRRRAQESPRAQKRVPRGRLRRLARTRLQHGGPERRRRAWQAQRSARRRPAPTTRPKASQRRSRREQPRPSGRRGEVTGQRGGGGESEEKSRGQGDGAGKGRGSDPRRQRALRGEGAARRPRRARGGAS